jgi:hypothetical protein
LRSGAPLQTVDLRTERETSLRRDEGVTALAVLEREHVDALLREPELAASIGVSTALGAAQSAAHVGPGSV